MARTPSKAAYYLVDISELPSDLKAEILEDAAAGGGEYGIRVVEEIHNGPARANIYGVYYGVDDEKWQAAKEELGISSSTVADEAVQTEDADPLKEAALRQAAEEAALVEAEKVRVAEAAEVEKITAPEKPPVTGNKANAAK